MMAKFSPSPSSSLRNVAKNHNERAPQANSLSSQTPYDYSPSNQDQERSQAQKVQGKDGLGNGVAGRRGIFDCHVDTHSLHILYTMHVLHTFAARY
jgi:hypothetical protein